MNSIEFNAVLAEITLGKPDKKGEESERQNIFPILIECEIDGDVLSGLLGIDKVPDFWNKKNGDPLFPLVSSIKSIVKYENHIIKLLDHTFENVSLRGFKFKPISQSRALISFKTTITDPTPEQLGFLMNSNKESLEIDVSCPQGELDI